MSRFWILPVLAVAFWSVQARQTHDLAGQARRHAPSKDTFAGKLVHAALDRTHQVVRYDPAYLKLKYPGGDVPAETGVCTDEVIRSYRTLGFDLQKLVHERCVAAGDANGGGLQAGGSHHVHRGGAVAAHRARCSRARWR